MIVMEDIASLSKVAEIAEMLLQFQNLRKEISRLMLISKMSLSSSSAAHTSEENAVMIIWISAVQRIPYEIHQLKDVLKKPP